MAAATPLAFSTWQALLNNFAIERAAFDGADMGMLQSLREVPGFLSFTAVFVLLILREQSFMLISLALLGIGTALTGFFPSVIGLYCTTVLMSIGFHYYETVHGSLTLQWIDKAKTPEVLGRQIAMKSASSLVILGLIWMLLEWLKIDYAWIYAIGGGMTAILAVVAWQLYPQYEGGHEQHKKLILRSKYWLYYALTFMSGARRQIFIVFAGFMMVEKFGYSAAAITALFIVNHVFNMIFAPRIGKLVGHWGERKALTFEYLGLIGVFTAYAFVESAGLAAVLYVLDHLFFAMAIAIRSYFQKIADPADIAASAGVSFTINHIAAVVIPAAFGVLWLVSPPAVFLAGAGMAFISLCLAQAIPPKFPTDDEMPVGSRTAT
ncbi:MAG: MFS transporter [Pseudomonadota bacterium]